MFDAGTQAALSQAVLDLHRTPGVAGSDDEGPGVDVEVPPSLPYVEMHTASNGPAVATMGVGPTAASAAIPRSRYPTWPMLE